MLKIKKLKFFQTLPEHRYVWSQLRKNIKNAEKKLFWENGGILCFEKFVSQAIQKPHNNSKTRDVFKGSEAFFLRFLKKRFFYKFSNSGKISIDGM